MKTKNVLWAGWSVAVVGSLFMLTSVPYVYQRITRSPSAVMAAATPGTEFTQLCYSVGRPDAVINADMSTRTLDELDYDTFRGTVKVYCLPANGTVVGSEFIKY